jgi:hypothetical protein
VVAHSPLSGRSLSVSADGRADAVTSPASLAVVSEGTGRKPVQSSAPHRGVDVVAQDHGSALVLCSSDEDATKESACPPGR